MFLAFFPNNTYNTNDNMNKETCGFKSKHQFCIIKELEMFQKELFDIVSSPKFRNTTDNFQKHLKNDIPRRNSFPDVLIFAAKANIYRLTKNLQIF